MSQTPSTPVKVPSSAANYSPATLDPDLRSQINTILLRDGHVPKYAPLSLCLSFFFSPIIQLTVSRTNTLRIQDRLLHALNADSSNWPTTIQEHALELLRSGQVLTFPALLKRVVDDIQEASFSSSSSSATANANGNTTTNGNSSSSSNKPTTNGVNGASSASSPSKSGNEKLSLAVPQSVVDETLKVTRECLENVCEITDQPGQ
jgi:hypothetical protein